MNGIELRLFRSFVALAEELHFSHAAARLKIAPPTLTIQIQTLETLVGAPLFNRKRKHRSLTLTDAGRRFLQHARECIRQGDEAINAARCAARGDVGRVEMACLMSGICSGVVQKILIGFAKERPGIEVSLRFMNTLGQVNALVNNQIDAGLGSLPKHYPFGVRGHVVDTEPLALVVNSEHPLARANGQIDPACLKDEPFIVTAIETNMGYERITHVVAKIGKFVPTVSRRASDMLAMLAHVSAGHGIGVVPRSLASLTIPNLVFRDFVTPEKAPYPMAFLYRSGEKSPATRALVDYVTRYSGGKNGAKM